MSEKWTLSTLPSLFSDGKAFKVVPMGADLSDAERFNAASRLILYGSAGLYYRSQDTRPLVYGLLALAAMQALGNGPTGAPPQVLGAEEPKEIPVYSVPKGDERPVEVPYSTQAGAEPVNVRARTNVKRRPARPFVGRNAFGKRGRFGLKPGLMDPQTQKYVAEQLADKNKEPAPRPAPRTGPSHLWIKGQETFPDHRAQGFGTPGVPTQMLITRPGEAPRPNAIPQDVVERHMRFPGLSRPKTVGNNPFADPEATSRKKTRRRRGARKRIAWDG